MQLLPHYEKAVIPIEKLRDYALNPDQPAGKDKARVFKVALGIEREHADVFAQILKSSLARSPAVRGVKRRYGDQWATYQEIVGLNGQSAVVTAGWIYRFEEPDVPVLPSYTQRGLDLFGMKLFLEAFASFAAALQIQPSDITRKNLAIALVAAQAFQGERKQAPPIAAFKQPIRMGLSYSACLGAYGATLTRLGDQDSARRILEKAVDLDPHNELAQANLARLQASQQAAAAVQMEMGITTIEPQPAQPAAA